MFDYEVFDTDTGKSHGEFETLDYAYGCVEFDELDAWEVWHTGACIAWSAPEAA